MIPAGAVEAAARCHYEAELGVNWDNVRPSVQRGYLDDARRMLEAAAPHMLREALYLADKWQADFAYKAEELRSALGVTND